MGVVLLRLRLLCLGQHVLSVVPYSGGAGRRGGGRASVCVGFTVFTCPPMFRALAVAATVLSEPAALARPGVAARGALATNRPGLLR